MLRVAFAFAAGVAVRAEDEACLSGFTADGPATKYVMTEAAKSIGAVCLDGTPGAYYHQPGSGDGVGEPNRVISVVVIATNCISSIIH